VFAARLYRHEILRRKKNEAIATRCRCLALVIESLSKCVPSVLVLGGEALTNACEKRGAVGLAQRTLHQ